MKMEQRRAENFATFDVRGGTRRGKSILFGEIESCTRHNAHRCVRRIRTEKAKLGSRETAIVGVVMRTAAVIAVAAYSEVVLVVMVVVVMAVAGGASSPRAS